MANESRSEAITVSGMKVAFGSSTGTVKWRGNKELLAWAPPISLLPPHWVIDKENPVRVKRETGTLRARYLGGSTAPTFPKLL